MANGRSENAKKTKLPLCIDQAKTDGAVALVYGKCKWHWNESKDQNCAVTHRRVQVFAW